MEWNWRTDITKEELIELYVDKKLSMRSLAQVLKCTRETARRHLRKYGISANYDRRDCLNTKYWQPTAEQEEIMIGMMLGDASIPKDKRASSCRLTLSHCLKQKEYFDYKANLLSSIFAPSSGKIYSYERDSGIITHCIVGSTYSALYFKKLRNMFYNRLGRKIVTSRILSMITAKSLAIWFMDDGCCKKLGMELATCSFSYTEHKLLQGWFMEKFGLRPIIRKQGNKKQHVLFFNKVNSYKLIQIIKPYIIPSMSYKIRLTITPQRLHVGTLREEKMIQSVLTGDSKRRTEMIRPLATIC